MRRRTIIAGIWRTPLLGIAWVLLILSPVYGNGNVFSSPEHEQQRGEAVGLEREGKWLQACLLYEKLLKEDRTQAEAREGYQRCLRHLQQLRRHRDPSFAKLLGRKPAEALDVYEEVLGELQKKYIDKSKTGLTQLFRQGVEELRFALEDEVFQAEQLAGVGLEVLKQFRVRLESWRLREIANLREARDQVFEIALEAKNSPLRLNPTAVVLEFVCGACNALDEYTSYLTPSWLRDVQLALRGNAVGVGLELEAVDQKLLVAQVVPNSSAAALGLKPRDRIARIGGKPVDEMPADIAQARLQGEAGTTVEVEIVSVGDLVPRVVKLVRQPANVPSVIDAKLMDGIGYLRIAGFQESTVQEIKEAVLQFQMAGLKALIIDLRGNGGGVFKSAVLVAELFIGDGVIVRTRSRLTEHNRVYQANNPSAWPFPLVVLIDGDTASASEVLAGALKERRGATLVGQTTFGKGLIQAVIPLESLPAGIRITVARFYSPSNVPYHGLGVSPHLVVPQQPGMDNQRDAAWQAAIDLAMGIVR
jgi:carboxyl-terminal processing protease